MFTHSIVSIVLAAAAGVSPPAIPSGVTRVVAGTPPSQYGGGPYQPPRDFISDAQREKINDAIKESIERLRAEGRLAPVSPSVHPLFAWPLRLAAGINDPGYHGISNFVDMNPAYPDQLLDWGCFDRTYDTVDGYNHRGTDFFTWPWSWLKMDRFEVEIVAAAAGQIVYRQDGLFDRSCGFNSSDWNAVYVQHADGSVSWYGHMKNGSPTKKQVGEMVAQGEYLGIVGSSGNSTGPHLHFETYDAAFNLIEPWSGPCNTLNPDTWWAAQRPYFDSGLDRLTTGDAAINFGSCPGDESPHLQATFAVGATIYFTAYYRDHLTTQPTTYSILRPDGSVFSSWVHATPVDYAADYWFWSNAIPVVEPQGTWKFRAEYLGDTFEKQFTVGSPAACGKVPDTPAQGELLRVEKIATSIRILWGASCNAKDTDYAVYEGVLGNFTSHVAVRCTTSGTRAAVLTAGSGGRYYLVSPRSATREGSLGFASNGVERTSAASCVPRFALPCP